MCLCVWETHFTMRHQPVIEDAMHGERSGIKCARSRSLFMVIQPRSKRASVGVLHGERERERVVAPLTLINEDGGGARGCNSANT